MSAKVREVMEAVGAQVQPSRVSVWKLGKIWHHTRETVEGGSIPPLTRKERGQLWHLSMVCPGRSAGWVIACCLVHWPVFVDRVRQETGLSGPDRPDVGFLTKHVGTAIRFNRELQAKELQADPGPHLKLVWSKP